MKKSRKVSWIKVNILKSQSDQIKRLLKNNDDFANISQFVVYAVRKEIELRKTNGMKNRTMPKDEQEIKEKLERWIARLKKEVELEYKLKKAVENDKGHTKLLSKN